MHIRLVARLFFIVVPLLIAVEIGLEILQTPTYIFPKPSDVWFALASQPETVFEAWRTTVAEAIVGLAVAVVVSFLIALLTLTIPLYVTSAINTTGIALQSTPLLALAPLLTLWFGQTFWAKALAATIVCFFPLLTGWLTGLRAVSPDFLELFENLNASKWRTFKLLTLPHALPYFFNGLRVSLPLSILGAIVAEFVGSAQGLGFQILQNSYYVRTPAMIGYVTIASITGIALTYISSSIERRTLFWHGDRRIQI